MTQDFDNPYVGPSPQKTGQPAAAMIWRWVSERGVRLETGETTLARYTTLAGGEWPEIEDIIPADGNVLLILRRGATMSAALRQALSQDAAGRPASSGTLHQITVEYGGAAGLDLDELAQQAGMNRATYIHSHSAVEYHVAFLGFQPGFPYLRGLPAALHAPRRASPRVRVAAGSVAIGGGYCGIYPVSGPGGWHLVGRADVSVFDPQRAGPALLLPGDRVRFVAA